MKVLGNTKYLVGMLLAIFAVGSIDALGQRRQPKIRRAKRSSKAKSSNYKVDTGTKIRVRMEREINSKVSQPGDRFETKVTEPVYGSSGVIVIPNGSTVIGKIDSVTKAKKGQLVAIYRKSILDNFHVVLRACLHEKSKSTSDKFTFVILLR